MFRDFAALCLLVALCPLVWAGTLSDPTLPLDLRGKVRVQEQLQLHSILIGGNRRLATINGRQVTEGQYIGDVLVLRIAADGVLLERSGRQWTLYLHGDALGINRSK